MRDDNLVPRVSGKAVMNMTNREYNKAIIEWERAIRRLLGRKRYDLSRAFVPESKKWVDGENWRELYR